MVGGGIPSDYFVSIQLQLWLFCCWGFGCCSAVTIILSGRCESKGFWSIGCGTVQFYQFPYHLLERDFDRVLVLESQVYVFILMTHLPLYVLSER